MYYVFTNYWMYEWRAISKPFATKEEALAYTKGSTYETKIVKECIVTVTITD